MATNPYSAGTPVRPRASAPKVVTPATVDYNTSMFPEAENEYIQGVAAGINYDPGVIAGWTLAEQPPGEPSNSANPYNYLNISENATVYRGTPTAIWQNTKTAIAATVEWIKTGGGVPGWGGPAGGIGSIANAANGSLATQEEGIQESGWLGSGSSGYSGLAADVSEAAGTGQAVAGYGGTGGTPGGVSNKTPVTPTGTAPAGATTGITRPGGTAVGESQYADAQQAIFTGYTNSLDATQTSSTTEYTSFLSSAANLATGGLYGTVSSAVGDLGSFLSFIAWIFSPINILRCVEFITGIITMGFGFWLTAKPGTQSNAKSATGRIVRVARKLPIE